MAGDTLTIGSVTAIHFIVNDLVARDPGISPHEVLEACENRSILDLIIQRADAYEVDASLLEMYKTGDRGRILLDNLESWANVADVERKYGFDSAGPFGWLALSQGFLDQFYRMYAGDQTVTW